MADFSHPGESEEFLNELSGAPAPPLNGSGQRQRVTRDMISFRYRWKQFFTETGPEALIVLLFALTVFFHFAPKPETVENAGLLAASAAVLHHAPAPVPGPESRAVSALLPMSGILLLTGGGPLPASATALLLWLGTLTCIYLTVRRLHSRTAGVLAALLFSLLPAVSAGAVSILRNSWLLFYLSLAFSLYIKSRQQKGAVFPLLSGIAAAAAIYCQPAAAVFAILFLLLPGTTVQKRLYISAGMIAGVLVFSGSFALLTRAPLFYELKALFSGFTATAYPVLPVGGLFYRLATAPELLPYAILSLFAIGYTFRTPRSGYPHLPFHLLLGCYFLLEFFPVSLQPYRTLAGIQDLPLLMSIPFALLLAPFLSGIGGRTALRWCSAASFAGALPGLFL